MNNSDDKDRSFLHAVVNIMRAFVDMVAAQPSTEGFDRRADRGGGCNRIDGLLQTLPVNRPLLFAEPLYRERFDGGKIRLG